VLWAVSSPWHSAVGYCHFTFYVLTVYMTKCVWFFLQVVWRAMQEEFIQQYKYIEELIQRCYPGSMIVLDFSIQNILEFFSEIARSH